jgi:hypothetical protein
MNITLSADEKLIKKTREYAKKHNTTLNNLIREYLKQLINEPDIESAAVEFEDLALHQSGRSVEGFTFNRTDIYSRRP